MEEKTNTNFIRNLLISYAAGAAVLVLMGVLLLWRYNFVMYDPVTFLSDAFTLGGLTYLVIWVLVLLSRTTFFARFAYLARKRSDRRAKKIPKYRTLQEYMDARPRVGFDVRLLWIPGLTFFAAAIVLAAAATA